MKSYSFAVSSFFVHIGGVAQLAEHQTFNLLVESSTLSALTTLKVTILSTDFSTNQGVTTLGLPTPWFYSQKI